MDRRRSTRTGLTRRWHALVEQYTPDGALGRWLLGSTTGTFGLWLLALALFEIPRWGPTLGALFWGIVLLGTGIPTLLFGLVVLWPVYLSLIGNVESTDAYSVSERAATATDANATDPAFETGTKDRIEPSEDDPFGDLKRQYANGDLSEDEFERRIESRLQDDTVNPAARPDESEVSRDRTPERN